MKLVSAASSVLLLLLTIGSADAFSRPVVSPRAAGACRKVSSCPTRLRAVEQQKEELSAVTSKQTDDGDVQQSSSSSEAQDALAAVGWSMPTATDEAAELTADDPFVQAIDAGIQRDFGVPLDDLLNPAKVVNLERDLFVKRTALAQLTGKTIPDYAGSSSSSADNQQPFLTTADCDGGGGGEEADALRQAIAKKEADLRMERRSVFQGWLKQVFLVQAVLSFGLSYVMATNPAALFGGFDWYGYYNMDLSISVLGYWWWWLFVVPSLRSRRPKGAEKKALDIAFLATPAVSLLAPVATKDTGLIWAANFLVVVAAYGYAFVLENSDDNGDDLDGDDDSKNQPAWLKFVFKSLDFGSGRERGVRR